MYGYSPITYLEGTVEVGSVRDDGYREIGESVHIAESCIPGLVAKLIAVLGPEDLEDIEGAIRSRWMELER